MQETQENASAGRTAGRAAPAANAALLDVQQVGMVLNVSPRTVRRLADAGKMPPAVRVGSLVRWNRTAIEAWIAAGCPSCRKAGRQ